MITCRRLLPGEKYLHKNSHDFRFCGHDVVASVKVLFLGVVGGCDTVIIQHRLSGKQKVHSILATHHVKIITSFESYGLIAR